MHQTTVEQDTQHKTLNLNRVILISYCCVTTQFENLRTLNKVCLIQDKPSAIGKNIIHRFYHEK